MPQDHKHLAYSAFTLADGIAKVLYAVAEKPEDASAAVRTDRDGRFQGNEITCVRVKPDVDNTDTTASERVEPFGEWLADIVLFEMKMDEL